MGHDDRVREPCRRDGAHKVSWEGVKVPLGFHSPPWLLYFLFLNVKYQRVPELSSYPSVSPPCLFNSLEDPSSFPAFEPPVSSCFGKVLSSGPGTQVLGSERSLPASDVSAFLCCRRSPVAASLDGSLVLQAESSGRRILSSEASTLGRLGGTWREGRDS